MWWRFAIVVLAVILLGSAVAHATGWVRLGVFGSVGSGRMLWVPLDSRPVNTSEVQLFATAAGQVVILPPAGLLDRYADRQAQGTKLMEWWERTARPGDTLVFYTNSMLAGGLIGSRDPVLYEGLEERLAALKQALTRLPAGRRVAVHVLPRAWPTQFQPDGSPSPDRAYTDLLLERTALQHRVFLFGQNWDQERLKQVNQAIPPEVRQRQDNLLAYNDRILEALLDWAEADLLDEVVVGLDDAQPYGMFNLLQRQFEGLLRERKLSGRVHVDYGADEIGFLLVAREALRAAQVRPRIAVTYDQAGAEGVVLPYEGVDLGTSVMQKLSFMGASQEQGGQRLFLYTERGGALSRHLLEEMAAERDEGIVLADVTSPGRRDRELVERLSERISLEEVAYAGWNTASNTVGTALAQAAVRELYARSGATDRQRVAFRSFQAIRYAHDLHFQAHRDQLAQWAGEQGIDSTAFGEGSALMADRLRQTVLREAREWIAQYVCTRGDLCLTVSAAQFPWDRTFEAEFRPSLESTAPQVAGS